MLLPSSSQQGTRHPADPLGARRYEYRYPTAARLIALGILLVIPLVSVLFVRDIMQPASLSDRLVPAAMALVLIGAAAYLAYRQAYFAWTTITIYERGLRLDFWRKHLVIPWSNVGKLYLGPGRMPRWQLVDKDERLLCELKNSAVGHIVSENNTDTAPPEASAPALTDAIIEQANLVLRELPFSHYAPASRRTQKGKKTP